MNKPPLSVAEQAVFDAISLQPFATQASLAETCAMSRAAVAGHVSQLTRKGYLIGRAYVIADRGRILCIGGAAVDRKYCLSQPLVGDTSNPALGETNFGGVARNVAENLARMNVPSTLFSVLGDDEAGRALENDLRAIGVDTTALFIAPGRKTADYVALIAPDGSLAYGIVSAGIFDEMTPRRIESARARLAASRIVFAECNLPVETLHMLAQVRAESGFMLAVDTISTAKAHRVRDILPSIDVLFCNRLEAEHLTGLPDFSHARMVTSILERGPRAVVMTCGAEGLWLIEAGGEPQHLPAQTARIYDVTGAGDALIAATLAGLMGGAELMGACLDGLAAAAIVSESPASTCPSDADLLIAARLGADRNRLVSQPIS